jgi:hypothetical protein
VRDRRKSEKHVKWAEYRHRFMLLPPNTLHMLAPNFILISTNNLFVKIGKKKEHTNVCHEKLQIPPFSAL